VARSKTVTFDSARADFTPYGLACVLWSPTPMLRPDRHNEVELNFLQSGSLTYLLGGQHVTVEAGRLVSFWGAIPHQILKWETTTPYFVLTLPLASFLSWGVPDRLAHALLAGELVRDPAPTREDGHQFRRWLTDFQSGRPLRIRVAELEVQARLLRLACEMPGDRTSARPRAHAALPSPSLSRADRIACYIARYYAAPLTADRIAKAVGLHPNYAMRLFRNAFGTTMVDFLVQHRLSHAQRLLVTTDDPVIDVASAAGFQSLSRFNEAFKRACGCAPRDYRKAHRDPSRQAPTARV
jgi:AraC-like DNA-binding protein